MDLGDRFQGLWERVTGKPSQQQQQPPDPQAKREQEPPQKPAEQRENVHLQDRETLSKLRQKEPGPAERLIPSHSDEIRAGQNQRNALDLTVSGRTMNKATVFVRLSRF